MGTIEAPLAEVLLPLTRRCVLGLLLSDAECELHLREIARRTQLAPASVQREVTALARVGILSRRLEGRQVYYRANRECPIFPELRGLVLKTVGLADPLRQALMPLADRIPCAFVFGSLADGTATNDSDVDLMVIGEVTLRDLAAPLLKAQELLGREINPVVLQPKELAQRKARGDPFLQRVLKAPRVAVIGDENEPGRLGGR